MIGWSRMSSLLWFILLAAIIKVKFDIYSNKKEMSDFHGTVSFDTVKMWKQK